MRRERVGAVSRRGIWARLIGATAMSALVGQGVVAQDAATGFVISINDDVIAADPAMTRTIRSTDIALAEADVQVSFDGLGAIPRLDLETVGAGPFAAGAPVTFQSALNYPVFVSRAEVRIIDREALGGARLVAVVPIDPNGQATVALPDGADLVAVHRVYDAQGRYDETRPLVLRSGAGRDEIDGVEEGADNTARRRIPITGGAITVRGSNVAPGATVSALGEVVQPDPSGGFVIQRILPAGDYGVDVRVQGGGQNVALTRDLTVPRAEWFYVATADLTYGLRESDGERERYTDGRLAFFADGKLEDGTRITASADTGEGPIKDIFTRLNERDPRSLLLRVDPGDLYPTYGDDSTLEDRTPTSGRFYLRIEKEGNFAQWGDFRAALGDNAFVRNDRTLYGAQAYIATREQTSAGEPRAQALAYAAQPDMLPQRDVFLGTGGSVFFLDKQDIAGASETLYLQRRDPDTGRVIESVPLEPGRDYQINYIQGVVTLSRPLQSVTTAGLFTDGVGEADLVLVAQYEYTPRASDVDGFAYGGRVDGWATDNLRFGLSAIVDETGANNHRVLGADVLWRMSDETYVQIDVARSEGSGFGSTFSADGGLIVDSVAGVGDAGEAVRAEARASLTDLGFAADGVIGGYFERRTEGFATLDAEVGAATGDERFAGLFADVALSEQLTFSAQIDLYENDVGDRDNAGAVEISYQATPQFSYALGVQHEDISDSTRDGDRTDVAARVTYTPDDQLTAYAFGQVTARAEGLDDNNRLGVGGAFDMGNGWTLSGEVSDGSAGQGGLLRADYVDADGNTRYLGYVLDPTRELAGVTLTERDRGRVVVGGRQSLSDTVDVFGENTYDLFGQHRSLTSAYGLTYAPSETLDYTVAFEYGQITDAPDYDFDRQALSFGVRYADDALTAAGRVEFRTEDGLRSGTDVSSETLLVSGTARYKIDETQRLVFAGEIVRSEVSGTTAFADGDYSDVVLGYAYRPIENDRLNVLARYRYLYDLYGYRRSGDDLEPDGPRQRSNVFSIDATYDVSPHWTVGGKLGYRSAETAADADADFVANDAMLLVANARYHLVANWDALIEVRGIELVQAETREVGVLGAVYRHIGENVKLGVGYNFGQFSDDLTDLTFDDRGAFINLVAKF